MKFFESLTRKDGQKQQDQSSPSKELPQGTVFDNIPSIIVAAARALVGSIDEILVDNASLSSDDMSGHYKLVELLESDIIDENIHHFSIFNGKGCISILLKYHNHASFIECCSQVGLAAHLVSSLRVLRMMEVKHGKPVVLTIDKSQLDSTESLTLKSSYRITVLLTTLCSSNQVIEQLRPTLAKLFCMPFSMVPETGVHFQIQTSQIVSVICQSALTSQIVWSMKDSQCIQQIIKAFRELISDSKSPNTEILLRGHFAERRGMWAIACKCLIDLIVAADAYSPVLRHDFENSGGFELLVAVILNSSRENSINVIGNALTLMNSTPSNLQVSYPNVVHVFVNLLKLILQTDVDLDGSQSIQELCNVGLDITKNVEEWSNKEYLFQHLVYHLLTLYSSNIQNYILLEQTHHLMPYLILSLPAFKVRETSSAVLKTLDYLCTEHTPTFCILAFCASIAVMIGQVAINHELKMKNFVTSNGSEFIRSLSAIPLLPEEQIRASKRLAQAVTYLEDILKKDAKYGTIFIRAGVKVTLCDYFNVMESEKLFQLTDTSLNAMIAYSSLLKLVVSVMKEYPSISSDIVATSLPKHVSHLIQNPSIDAAFVKSLLLVLEQQSKSDLSAYGSNLGMLLFMLTEIKDQRDKCSCILDSISTILQHDGHSLYSLWQEMDGFNILMDLLRNLKACFVDTEVMIIPRNNQTIDNTSHLNDRNFKCLEAILHCFAVSLSLFPSGTHSELLLSNAQYFKEHLGYQALAQCIIESMVLQTSYSEMCIHQLFCLISGGKNECCVVNADAFILMMEIIPELELSKAADTIKKMQFYALSQIDGCQLISKAGVLSFYIDKFQANLKDSNSYMHADFKNFLLTICGECLSLHDFKAILGILVKPDVLLSLKTSKLLLSWEMFDKKGIISLRNWESAEILLQLAELSCKFQGVSFVALGQRASNCGENTFLYFQWAENSSIKSFPVNSFSYSCWAQLGRKENYHDKQGGVVPIFCMSSPSLASLEVFIEPTTSMGKVIVKSSKLKPILWTFNVPFIGEYDWHLFVLTVKRPKRVVTSTKTLLTIFFDGQSIFSEKLEYDPIPPGSVEVFIGKAFTDCIEYNGQLEQINFKSLWYAGPILFFDESLSQIQVSKIMTKGPNYHGIFQGETPQEDSLSVLVTDMLCKSNATFLDVSSLMESLGLQGLENVVVPLIENNHTDIVSFDMPILPPPILAYSALNEAVIEQRKYLVNYANDLTSNFNALIVNGRYISKMNSLASCVNAIGGMGFLMPLIQAASTERQLIISLNLVLECTRNDLANMRYMHNIGYRILSFLLSRKPKELISEQVVNTLLSLVVDRGIKSTKSSIFSILIVDTLALYHLILCHIVWDIRRYHIANQIVDLLKSSVCEDARNAALNALRLAPLGVIKWLLNLLLFGCERSVGNNRININDSSKWIVQCRTNDEEINCRESKDPVVTSSVYVIKAIIMNDTKKNGIEDISNVILHCSAMMFPISGKKPNNKRTTPLEIGQSEGNSELSPYATIIVSLLRLLREVFSSSIDAVGGEFSLNEAYTALSPKWFLLLLQRHSDSMAIVAFSLRLLAALLLRDSNFRKLFIQCDGFRALLNILCVEEHNVAEILPLFAILLRIPIKFLPLQMDVSATKLIELVEKTENGFNFDSELIEITLPVLAIILGCYSTNCRRCVDGPQCATNTFINNVLHFLIFKSRTDAFLELSQHRYTVEIYVSALLKCSNAAGLYGSKIYDESNCSLIDSLQEDYVSINFDDSHTDGKESQIDSIDQDRTSDFPIKDIVLFRPDGEDILEIIVAVIRSALTRFHNPQIILFYLLGFPKQTGEAFASGYQNLIFEKMAIIIKPIFHELNFEALLTVCNVFTLLVPVAKARLLFDSVLLNLLELIYYGLEFTSSNEAMSILGEKYAIINRDIVLSARYFTILCINILNTQDCMLDKLTLLQLIRTHASTLLSSFEDHPDFAKNKRDETKCSSVAILENFHITIAANTSTKERKKDSTINESTYSACTTEKIRVAGYLNSLLLVSLWQLFRDESHEVRKESMRLCSSLILLKRNLVELLCTTIKRTLKGESSCEDVAEYTLFEGLSILLPEPQTVSFYLKQMKMLNPEIDGESDRFVKFDLWLHNEGCKCENIISFVENVAISVLPHVDSIDVTFRELQAAKVKLDSLQNNDVEVFVFWSDDFQRMCDLISNRFRSWLIYGYGSIAAGGCEWKSLWCTLQSSETWGYVSPSLIQESNAHLKKFAVDFPRVLWRLDNLEGPEKCRHRLEQDYDEENLVKDCDDLSNNSAIYAPANYSDFNNFEELLKQITSVKLSKPPPTGEEKVDFSFDEDDDAIILSDVDDADDDDLDEESSKEISLGNDFTDHLDFGEPMAQTNLTWALEAGNSRDSEVSTSQSKRFTVKLSKGILSAAAMAFPDAVKSAIIPRSLSIDHEEAVISGSPTENEAPSTSTTTNLTNLVLSNSTIMDEEFLRRSSILIEIVKGLIGVEEWCSGDCSNISRIFGLEARVALLILTQHNIHIIDGFQICQNCNNEIILDWSDVVSQNLLGESSKQQPATRKRGESHDESSIMKLNRAASKYKNVRKRSGLWSTLLNDDDIIWIDKIWYQLLHVDFGYFKMPLNQIITVYTRRHQLKNCGLEIVDSRGLSLLFACSTVTACEQVLKKLLTYDLPNSIFRKIGMKNLQISGGLFAYRKIMAYYLSNLTKTWQKGGISNFEYLMHINAIAGRSYQDLTQYPVFPWIIADYDSDFLDFSNKATFRDLSKPMGALGEKRAQQYKERYDTMAEFRNEGVDGAPPPFFYGTHYSCAGYVLYYLMRLQPYSRLAKTLQGGQFDVPDRLFKGIKSSWLSASQENLQDVRELIPEFFDVPEFLLNTNRFDFGTTQNGEVVNDVILPPWAKGSPVEFIRMHREALECKYVSENLHHWIDLIFGYKQRGPEAVNANNVFIHLTYDGEVDIDAIADPILKEATLSQINNFGQTPLRLFSKPHPKKIVPEPIKKTVDGFAVDSSAVQWHEHLSPPLCIAGTNGYFGINKISFGLPIFPPSLKVGAIGDIRIVSRDRILAVPSFSILVPPKYVKYVKYGKLIGGISFHSALNTPRPLDVDKNNSLHENLHSCQITCVSFSRHGDLLATGGEDCVIKLWELQIIGGYRRLENLANFSGHCGAIVCLDISFEFSIVVSGSADRTVMIWDIKRKRLFRTLCTQISEVISVSINNTTGNIAVLSADEVRFYSINGILLCYSSLHIDKSLSKGTAIIALPCHDWQNGVVVVTGHENGSIVAWKIKENKRELISQATMKVHKTRICVLRLCGKPMKLLISSTNENLYELLAGDSEGNVSRWNPVKLDQFSQSDLQQFVSTHCSF